MIWAVICLFVLIFTATVTVAMLAKQYTIIRVNGNSMSPALKHGEFYLLMRSTNDWYDSLEVGKIYVISPPSTGHNSIKRLKSIKHNSLAGGYYLWFEGDNAEVSLDSRSYGFLRETDVIGRVVTKK